MTIEARFHLTRGGFVLQAAFTAPARGVTAIFGPSGAGKTTLLRCVAGLERAPGGFLRVGETVWQDESAGLFTPVHRRPLGYVFQEASLFPHLSVRRNLDYGWRRVPKGERRIDRDEVLRLTGVGPLLDRRPASLSGGERQRAAIARALLANPRLLLMDEPLAGLDPASKAEILPCLERLHERLALPVLYVSHHPDEVARLANQMVLLEAGRVLAAGPLAEVLTRLDLPLAHAEGAETIVETTVAGHDEAFHLTYLAFPGGRFTVARLAVEVGQRVRLRVHARDISLALTPARDTSILNIFAARVLEIALDHPAQVTLRLDAGGTILLARITRKSAAQLALAPGTAVWAQVKSVAVTK